MLGTSRRFLRTRLAQSRPRLAAVVHPLPPDPPRLPPLQMSASPVHLRSRYVRLQCAAVGASDPFPGSGGSDAADLLAFLKEGRSNPGVFRARSPECRPSSAGQTVTRR